MAEDRPFYYPPNPENTTPAARQNPAAVFAAPSGSEVALNESEWMAMGRSHEQQLLTEGCQLRSKALKNRFNDDKVKADLWESVATAFSKVVAKWSSICDREVDSSLGPITMQEKASACTMFAKACKEAVKACNTCGLGTDTRDKFSDEMLRQYERKDYFEQVMKNVEKQAHDQKRIAEVKKQMKDRQSSTQRNAQKGTR